MPLPLRTTPRIGNVSVTESPLYQSLGVGRTENLFFLGHADNIPLNHPYLVTSIEDAHALIRNENSPLFRALIEAYYAGARDIWLMAVARMEDYEPELTLRDQAYYESYRDSLTTAYEILEDYDVATYVAPIEAPFNSTVDFLGPLVEHCFLSYRDRGQAKVGLIATRGQITNELIDTIVADSRLSAFGEAGKFTAVFAGDLSYNFRELSLIHNSSVLAYAAGLLARSDLDASLVNRRITHAARPVFPDLPLQNLNRLAEAKVNPITQTTLGKRGKAFESIILTDNTLAEGATYYWSLNQTRMAVAVSKAIERLGSKTIGTIGFGLFKDDVKRYLNLMVNSGYLRSYEVTINRDPKERTKILVDVVLQPYFGLREISLNLTVGPLQLG